MAGQGETGTGGLASAANGSASFGGMAFATADLPRPHLMSQKANRLVLGGDPGVRHRRPFHGAG